MQRWFKFFTDVGKKRGGSQEFHWLSKYNTNATNTNTVNMSTSGSVVSGGIGNSGFIVGADGDGNEKEETATDAVRC